MKADYRNLIELIRDEKKLYGAATAALCLGALFSYMAPLVAAGVIDGVLAATDVAPTDPGALGKWPAARALVAQHLWLAGLAMVLLTALGGAFTYLRGRWSAIAAEEVVCRLRDRLYDNLQHAPCSYHDRADTGDLVQRCTSDVDTLKGFLAEQVVEIGRAVLMLAIALPVMLWMDVRMTLVALALFPPIIVFALFFFRRVQRVFQAADEAEGELTTVLQENLTGIRVVRAFARQEFERSKFARRNQAFRDESYRLIRLLATYWSVSDLLCLAQVGLVLIFGAHRVGQGTLSVGTLFAFLTWVNLLIWPVRQLGRVLTETGKSTVAIKRLRAILDEPRETDAVAASGAPQGKFRGAIEFRNVSFAHASGGPVLSELSLSIAPGQTLALLGPPGSGKSTLVHLLLRLYDYQQGSISLDGHELRELPRKTVRAAVSVVLQEPFLYSKTLRENLSLGRDDAPEEELVSAASTACVHDTIVDFAQGYDTPVGERGVTLSGGQRQRVALARALLKDAPVLVLDDALSAVDTRTEARIREALVSRHGRRTTIVIAHRLSSVTSADRIVVLDAGRIVQSGSHTELVRINGAYRRFWQLQSALEDEIEQELSAPRAAGE